MTTVYKNKRPSKSTQNSLHIKNLVASFTDALVEAVDAAVHTKISTLLQNNFANGAGAGVGDSGAGDDSDDSDTVDLGKIDGLRAAAARARKAKAKRPKQIRPCKVPKCKKPSKGPRFHFLCEDHRELGARKLAEAMAGISKPKPAKAKPAKAKPAKKSKPRKQDDVATEAVPNGA